MTAEVLVGGALLLLALSRLRGGGGGQRVIAAVRKAFGETVPQPVAAGLEKHAPMHGVPLSIATAWARRASRFQASLVAIDPTSYDRVQAETGKAWSAFPRQWWGAYGLLGLTPLLAEQTATANPRVALDGLLTLDGNLNNGLEELAAVKKAEGDWQTALKTIYAEGRGLDRDNPTAGAFAAAVMADAGALRLAGIDEVPRA